MDTNSGNIPSDNLAPLRQLGASLAITTGIHQVRIVVDSNYVLGDLRWLIEARKNSSARSAFQEVVANKTIIAFAPHALKPEVEKHLPDIAQDVGVDASEVWRMWESYQQAIHFVMPGRARTQQWASLRDPTDLPFVCLVADVGADAVLTHDKDIWESDADTINLDIILSLRDYSRAAAPEMTIKMGGAVMLVASAQMLRATVELVGAACRWIGTLPSGVKLFVLFMGALALAHPKSRRAISGALRWMTDGARQGAAVLAPALVTLANDLETHQSQARAMWESTGLKSRNRFPARTVAYAVLLAAQHPLTAREIAIGMRAAGYVSSSARFRSYLVRVMRKDSRFVEVEPGLWTAVS